MLRTVLPDQNAGSAGTPATILLAPITIVADTASLTNHQVGSQMAFLQRANVGHHTNMLDINILSGGDSLKIDSSGPNSARRGTP